MADEEIWRSANAPADLPTLDDIVKSCADAGFNRNGVCIEVLGKPRFWAKYGGSVIRGEGLTQAHVAGIVNADPVRVVRVPEVYLIFSREECGYIVMELVEGTTFAKRTGKYGKDDIKAVAAAVRRLTDIKMPAGTAPGPIGGGRIGHDFFVDFLSTLEYPTVGHLEDQINAVCFPLTFSTSHSHTRALVANKVVRPLNSRLSVDFRTETANGLVLCPSDLDDSNFMVDTMGNLWAIDFGRTCFLPPSFVHYSLTLSPNVFGRRVAHLVKYPQSANFKAMMTAAGQLVVFNDNSLGKYRHQSCLATRH